MLLTLRKIRRTTTTPIRRLPKLALALTLLAAIAPGCGDIAGHAPEIGTALGAGIGGAILYEKVQDARTTQIKADQEAVKLETMQLDLESKRRNSTTPAAND